VQILFPSNPLKPKAVDDSFGYEAQAAKEAGFGVSRVDLEVILGGEVKLGGVPEARDDLGLRDILYRGWLMKPECYRALSDKLERRLVTGPVSYEIAYNLPQWYPLFAEGVTPRTLILPGKTFDLDEVAKRVWETFCTRLSLTDQARVKAHGESFQGPDGSPIYHTGHLLPELMELPGKRPVMVKDYLKSAKHRWFDACYMPDCQDLENTKRVTKNFLDNQSDNLTGGLCFRQFIPCRQIGIHSKIGMPLVNEWRAFLKFGKVFYLCPYWAEGDYSKGTKPTVGMIEEMCVGLRDIPLVAVDLGEKDGDFQDDASWVVYEVNDGGGSGIPDGGDVKEFYRALSEEFA
jgi:ATP-grasp domain, R2K clade family 3